MLSDQEITRVISLKMGDPKPDLKNHILWESLLKFLFPISERLYQAFRGMRACGADLKIADNNLNFSFPPDYSEEFKDLIRKKYIKPYAGLIKDAIKKVVAVEKAMDTSFSKRIPV